MKLARRNFIALLGSLSATAAISSTCQAVKPADLVEPVHRVANASLPSKAAPLAVQPLEQALDIARNGLSDVRAKVDDYTAILVMRENIDGELGPHNYIAAKIRNRKVSSGRVVQPFSVYLNFLRPSSVKGREVIYVEGQNDGNMIAHEGGFKGKYLPTVRVKPTSGLAMRGQRYPMTEIGIENLIVKLIERGEKAGKYPDVTCEIRQNAKIKDRFCTVFDVVQPTKRPDADFYQAQVFIDDALKVPIRYVAYDWPRRKDAPLTILEEYNYLNLKTNVGLTDKDFDAENPAYNF